jgi:patatin-like phospholipase/acyl hydrolase
MFRILALDGGGIRGTFSAAVLEQFEEQLGDSLIDYFDLTVGTSTGGIIALGLGCGIEASRILSLYKDEGRKIFPPSKSGWIGLINSFFAPKFANDDLKTILRQYFSDRPFTELKHNIAITSFDAACARPIVFKTCYHPSLKAYGELSIIDVALATSAAPAYFAAAEVECGVMIDGGVWANCPVMVAVTEALSLFRRRIDEIYVLSIGTTSIPAFVQRDQRKGGLLQWALPAPTLLMHAAKLGAIEGARKLCKELIRIDEVVDRKRFPMDGVRAVDDLAQIGRNSGRQAWNKVEPIFFSTHKEDCQAPVRPSTRGASLLGARRPPTPGRLRSGLQGNAAGLCDDAKSTACQV